MLHGNHPLLVFHAWSLSSCDNLNLFDKIIIVSGFYKNKDKNYFVWDGRSDS